jgi:hypothetical protein
LKFSFSVGFAEVNCRTDGARVRVDILDHQGTSFGNPTGRVETNAEEGAIALRKQTFVEQKLDFLLRKYFGLAVPFYFHLCVNSTRYQKVCRSYCITASVDGDFLTGWWVGVIASSLAELFE